MDSNRLSLIDTHAHLCAPEFSADLDAVLSRARESGVAAVIAVGETIADADRNLDLSRWHPMIRPAAGLYPTVLEPAQAETLQRFIRRNRSALVAVGEVGLDHWMVKEEKDRELQSEIFKGFIGLARELDLPLNVHSRSAGRQAIELLLRSGAARVQMHAFDGRASTALPAVEAGFLFSIPPSVVRSRQKQKLVKRFCAAGMCMSAAPSAPAGCARAACTTSARCGGGAGISTTCGYRRRCGPSGSPAIPRPGNITVGGNPRHPARSGCSHTALRFERLPLPGPPLPFCVPSGFPDLPEANSAPAAGTCPDRRLLSGHASPIPSK